MRARRGVPWHTDAAGTPQWRNRGGVRGRSSRPGKGRGGLSRCLECDEEIIIRANDTRGRASSPPNEARVVYYKHIQSLFPRDTLTNERDRIWWKDGRFFFFESRRRVVKHCINAIEREVIGCIGRQASHYATSLKIIKTLTAEEGRETNFTNESAIRCLERIVDRWIIPRSSLF